MNIKQRIGYAAVVAGAAIGAGFVVTYGAAIVLKFSELVNALAR